jgi:hypothetical protein
MKTMSLEDFFSNYLSHETRFYCAEYNPIKQTFSFKLEYSGWIKEHQEKLGNSFNTLEVIFFNVENFNICNYYSVKPKQKLEEIDDDLFDIAFDAGNTISIITDETDYETHKNGETVIKFVAKEVAVIEIN